MDGIPPSICPTGVYRPPSRPVTSSDFDAAERPPPVDVIAVRLIRWLRGRAIGFRASQHPEPGP